MIIVPTQKKLLIPSTKLKVLVVCIPSRLIRLMSKADKLGSF